VPGDRAVEQVGQAGEHEPEHGQHQVAVGDEDGGPGRGDEAQHGEPVSREAEHVQRAADGL